jgi:nitroreductase
VNEIVTIKKRSMSSENHKMKSLGYVQFPEDEMLERSVQFFEEMDRRRSVRHFSDRELPDGILEYIVKTAGTAPSGANKQPWHFCVIEDSEMKKRIREAAEEEEQKNYEQRMSDEWLEDLEKLGTDPVKEHLTEAPALIIVFKQSYTLTESGEKEKNYYVNESIGIAAGMLITAIHHAGLVTLTHTPSPMKFLSEILERPPNESAILVLPVGYPAEDAEVPDIGRKPLDKIMTRY